MSSAEGAAYKGLQQCIETVMAEVSATILDFLLRFVLQLPGQWILRFHLLIIDFIFKWFVYLVVFFFLTEMFILSHVKPYCRWSGYFQLNKSQQIIGHLMMELLLIIGLQMHAQGTINKFLSLGCLENAWTAITTHCIVIVLVHCILYYLKNGKNIAYFHICLHNAFSNHIYFLCWFLDIK